MNSSVLNFNLKRQIFEFNEEVAGDIDFRHLALEKLFNEEKSYVLIKNFIDKDLARKIRDYYSKTETSKSFVQAAEGSNHRIFYYKNSPFKYPRFIVSLLERCMVFKNRIYEYHDYYQTYCMVQKVNPKNYEEVTRIQDLHSWSSVYWYKNGNSHFKHIDNYGELACFLILSQKGSEYESGGLQVYRGDEVEDMDDSCEYGDLLFLDQSKVFHEVLPIKTSGNQIGRLNIYIPTIPPSYMKRVLTFEGYPYQVFFTDKDLSCGEKMGYWIQNFFMKEKIHYSRKNYKHFKDTF
jgi:hypothetical protein